MVKDAQLSYYFVKFWYNKIRLMDQGTALSILKENQNERGISKWNEKPAKRGGLESFGIGLTVLRKLAKKIGRDHDLALELWQSDIYDAKILALLIDDPKQITREQAEIQVDQVKIGHLAHVFSSCDAALAKTEFTQDLALEWIHSTSSVRKSCGYGLIYELSKSKKKNAPDEKFFEDIVHHIESNFHKESISVQGSMGGALLGIGKRSAPLNRITLNFAKATGPIELESEGEYCEPLNLEKHLTSDYIRKKLELDNEK